MTRRNLKRILPWLRATGLALGIATLQACSSSTTVDHTGSSALRNLDSGWCPGSIVNSQGKDARGKTRYQRSLSAGELANLRQRELRNCQQALDRGDTQALATLVDYYDIIGQEAELVSILEQYALTGTDSQRLGQAGTYLYRAYSEGSAAVPRDPTKAFNYLGLAVNNGARALEINYARALTARSLYTDAHKRFSAILASQAGWSSLDRCEAHLGLAYLEFGLAPAMENWNTAYYHWRDGMALAKGKEWASCSADNFTSPHYSYESRRKAFVEARLPRMSAAQKQIVDEARRDAAKGLTFVAALDFRAPHVAASNARPAATFNSAGPTQPAVAGRWRPLQADICRLQSIPYAQPWTTVFENNSQSVWTVDSRGSAGRSTGTAIAVSPRTLVTNCHLLSNPRQIKLRRIGTELSASLVAVDTAGDRCVLQTAQTLPSYVQYARAHDSVRIGEEVAAIGNPRGLETSLSRGIVGQKRARRGLRLIQTDAAISSGSSGGGLFDQTGNLVGITTFSVSEGQSLNFAIAIEEFCR
ncbi:hypothetical protein A3709_07260 [Halioglobus sp. HI00S01]|uniref:S1C family serine protease n=1 Tax=Halioglobus sp. HI00S01 TaxID=1822214 RepID=UPI0007C30F3F|nr:S1C family serine protease [Halioglobus sp. HI00S01]KZX54822.1 hypothetical protein A3709_07260 [Halioglobus sp. HI00S01]